jgi:hypothetical protein
MYIRTASALPHGVEELLGNLGHTTFQALNGAWRKRGRDQISIGTMLRWIGSNQNAVASSPSF